MKLLNLFKWNRNFLAKSQLRSLRNLNQLPSDAVATVLNSIVDAIDKQEPIGIIESASMRNILWEWYHYCQDTKNLNWLQLTAGDYLHALDNPKDPFAGCYFSDGTITSIGLSLRMETRLRANADKLSSR